MTKANIACIVLIIMALVLIAQGVIKIMRNDQASCSIEHDHTEHPLSSIVKQP